MAPKNLWTQIIIPLVAMWVLVTVSMTITTFAVSHNLDRLKGQIEEASQIGVATVQLVQSRSLSRELLLQYRLSRDQTVKVRLAALNVERSRMLDTLRSIATMDSVQSRLLVNYQRFSQRGREIERSLLEEIERDDREPVREHEAAYRRMEQLGDASLLDMLHYTRNLTVAAEQRMSQIVHGLAAVFAFVLVLSAVLIGAIAYYYRGTILAPLDRLRLGFKAVARGHLHYRLQMPEVAGQMAEMIGDFNRMTEALEQTRKDLTVAREDALQAAGAKSEFLSNMSHEIRTPLNAILGMAEVLWEQDLSSEAREHLRILRRSGSHLLTLINDILDYSRLEGGKLELEEECFDLPTFIAGVEAVGAPLAQAKGLELRIVKDAGVPQQLVGDQTRLHQVLLNLVGNAVKFTEKGSVEIAVRAQDVNGKSRLVFTVSDTGIGISADKLGLIFLRFSQADSGVNKIYGGTGLGLAISKQLVEMMGGEISVESREAAGSQFTFWIPLAAVSNASVAVPKMNPSTSSDSAGLAFRQQKVLLVDDSADNRVLVQALLKKENLQIETATNGLQAVERCQRARFDLILMDMQMPVMDGYSAVREIRQWERLQGLRPTPIVALTAYALKEEIARSVEAGCDHHLSKPFSKTQLIEALRRFMA